MNVDGSVAEKLKVADVSITEPDGPESMNVFGRVVSGVGPGSSGAKPIPAWSSRPNMEPSLPTHSPCGVASRTMVPCSRDLVGFHGRAMPVTGLIAPMPGRETAPAPAESLPCGLSSQRWWPPTYTAGPVIATL